MIIIQLFTFLLCINTVVCPTPSTVLPVWPSPTHLLSLLVDPCSPSLAVETMKWGPQPVAVVSGLLTLGLLTVAVLPVLINKGIKCMHFLRAPVTCGSNFLLHHPEAVWTSVVEHHPSHWVHRSSTTVTMDCSPLMWGPAHALMWGIGESGWRILGAWYAGRGQVKFSCSEEKKFLSAWSVYNCTAFVPHFMHGCSCWADEIQTSVMCYIVIV